jgi:hypothetical protein
MVSDTMLEPLYMQAAPAAVVVSFGVPRPVRPRSELTTLAGASEQVSVASEPAAADWLPDDEPEIEPKTAVLLDEDDAELPHPASRATAAVATPRKTKGVVRIMIEAMVTTFISTKLYFSC